MCELTAFLFVFFFSSSFETEKETKIRDIRMMTTYIFRDVFATEHPSSLGNNARQASRHRRIAPKSLLEAGIQVGKMGGR